MKQHLYVVFITILIWATHQECNSAKILAVVPSNFYSHQISYRPIWKELIARGHHLTLVTPNPITDLNTTKLRQIDFSFLYNKFNKKEMVKMMIYEEGKPTLLWQFIKKFGNFADSILSNKDLQNLVNDKEEKFDLLFVEMIGPLLIPLGMQYNIPKIGILSMEPEPSIHDSMGNYVNHVIHPHVNLGVFQDLSFTDRFKTALFALISHVLITKNSLLQLAEKHFHKKCSIDEVKYDLDMMFIIDNPACRVMRPITPSTIYLRGLRKHETQQLPEKIKDYLDKSKNGVIYFSLGSNIDSGVMPENLINTLVEAFSEVPYDVLWKYDDELLNKPSNVYTAKWVPQQAVLDHPNVKLFITQGGCQSLEETITSQVPILGMPFFGDQKSNVKRAVAQGMGLIIDKNTITKEELKSTIQEIISNPVYLESIKKISKMAFDQPMSAIDSAMWHVDYVLRNNGAKHLKGPSINFPWYQYYLLDVIAVILIIIFTILALLYYFIKKIFNCFQKVFQKKTKIQ